MAVIRHADQLTTRGFFSKIFNRKIVTGDMGAVSCTVWEQTIPPGGYIAAHLHDFEEVLTFLSGCVQLTIDGECQEVGANTTVFIRPHLIHSVVNQGDEPARLMAFLMSADPQVIYPNGQPVPVFWNDDN